MASVRPSNQSYSEEIPLVCDRVVSSASDGKFSELISLISAMNSSSVKTYLESSEFQEELQREKLRFEYVFKAKFDVSNHSDVAHIYRVKADLDKRSREAFRNFDVAAEPAVIAKTDPYTALLNLKSDESHVLEMINALPDQASTHRLLEEFEISRSKSMPTIKESMVKSELRKIERDHDIGGQSLPSDGSPELRIDMPKENIDPAEKHKSSEEAVKSVADRVNEGGLAFLISSSTNVASPSWLRTAMDAARVLAYASTAAGYGTRAYNEKLSEFLSKVGALAVSAVVIAWLAMPFPPVVAWIVGLAAWLIAAAAVLFN